MARLEQHLWTNGGHSYRVGLSKPDVLEVNNSKIYIPPSATFEILHLAKRIKELEEENIQLRTDRNELEAEIEEQRQDEIDFDPVDYR